MDNRGFDDGANGAAMSMKKSDLDKNLGMKIGGRMKGVPVPGRFAQEAAGVPDRREQRRLDSAAGLVPFACKLPLELARRIHDRAVRHSGGLNALVAELLHKGLD